MRKGIILAGGTGSRLWPITQGVSKQLLPVFDKPMIYYPLSTLMLAGIKEIAIITTAEDQPQFRRLLGDGRQWGVQITYLSQASPDGIAQAFTIAQDFLDGSPSALVLGDNIFFGHGLQEILKRASNFRLGGTIFGYHVSDPERYGVVGFDREGRADRLEEKPKVPASSYAVTGLYFLDSRAPEFAKEIHPSERGELEITTLLEIYLREGSLNVETLGRGFAWLDTGTTDSLLEAGSFVRTLWDRQGMQIGSPEEIAYRSHWISKDDLLREASRYDKNPYGSYLASLADQDLLKN